MTCTQEDHEILSGIFGADRMPAFVGVAVCGCNPLQQPCDRFMSRVMEDCEGAVICHKCEHSRACHSTGKESK